MDTRIKEKRARGVFLINAHQVILQLYFDGGSVLVDIPRIPRIPADSGDTTYYVKDLDSSVRNVDFHSCINIVAYCWIRDFKSCTLNHHMEHYKKKQSRLFDTATLPNEIKVSGSSKAHDLCTKAVHKLKEYSADGVIVSASGNHVTKAVTVVELLKRRVPNLHQDTQLKYIKIEDVWEPDTEDLDSLKVVRRIPAISMHLVDTSSSSTMHQTQTLADEHHQVAMASSEHSVKSTTSTRSGGHRAGTAPAAERRDKGKGQGSRSQGGGRVKKPGKRTQAATGRVKGRSKSAQANETAEDSMDQA